MDRRPEPEEYRLRPDGGSFYEDGYYVRGL
jgi:hypothetical protein